MSSIQNIARAEVSSSAINPNMALNTFWFEGSNDGGSI
jgi:hypothetical protein